MKFSVLALDYDGTIARDSKTHVTIADAIREARRQGIVLVLVTGRVLSDLRWLLNGQDLFDVIVAENGAVIEYSNGRTRKFGGPPPQEFLLPQGITKAIGFVFRHAPKEPRVSCSIAGASGNDARGAKSASMNQLAC
jgi:hydroxymethylpyrimidine pyrophosphatase-like HAD family hydrolase